MEDKWRTMTLQEANVALIDCDHRTPSPANSGYPYVAIPQLQAGRIDLSEVRRISREDYIGWTRKAKANENDVILSRRCNPGETAFVPPHLEFALGQNLVLLRADGSEVYPPFLRWLARGPEWWAQVSKFINVGAVFDSLRCADVPNFSLSIPPFPEQRAIAHILGTLDDKIELNRRMNVTLEAMAQALFKSCFVDFEPVRAKAKGRDAGLPKHIADLFPDRFQDSELGAIPKGWQACTWGDLVTLEYGRGLRGYADEDGPYPVYGTNGRIGTHCEPLCQHPGIIIGRKGAYRGVHFCNSPFYVIDTAFYIKAKTPLAMRWAFYEILRHDINGMDSGSAIPSTSREDFYNLPVSAPPFEIQRRFVENLNPVWVRQEHNEKKSVTVAAIRDALLPKLLSGEIRVKDAEKVVEDAV